MKTLLATAAIVIASATGAAASNVSDAILYELSRKSFQTWRKAPQSILSATMKSPSTLGNRHRSAPYQDPSAPRS